MLNCVRSLIGEAKFILNLLRTLGKHDGFIPAYYIGAQNIIISPMDGKTSLFLDGWYLATPKKRRSLDRRRIRKFMSCKFSKYQPVTFTGFPVTMDKYRPRDDLVSCTVCGYLNPKGFLCVNCYEKVREETNALRSLIGNELPSDREVRFVYEDDPRNAINDASQEVHVNHPRPSWFPISLLQRVRNRGTGDS
ncbi:39S ribosomal protein L32 mitochondrial [Paragonimus heterotremus]|uniref:39S ribosomal protein L32 mitochondrial n=1 Tax=Paragonimus heterotremus TaxID=100268 RepID=A0A8J4T754_9TREM|nr:39S ribosomal protein L32 mitochondrial [Paragonimus heterotremus]